MNESDASSESGAEEVTSVHSNDHDTNCLPKGSTSFTAYVLHNILQLGLLLCVVFFNYSKKKNRPNWYPHALCTNFKLCRLNMKNAIPLLVADSIFK